MTLREAEKVLIAATLGHAGGSVAKAAAILGINRTSLYEKINRYGIPKCPKG